MTLQDRVRPRQETRFDQDDPRVQRALGKLMRLPDKPAEIQVRSPLRYTADGVLEVDVAAARALLVELSFVLSLAKDGAIQFSSDSVQEPLALDETSGAIRLDIGTALEVTDDGKLAVTQAADVGAAAGFADVVAQTWANSLRDKMRTAGLME